MKWELWEQLVSSYVYGRGTHATVYHIFNVSQRKYVARKVLKMCTPGQIQREADVQRRAATRDLAPKVFALSGERCTIDMEPVGDSLKELCKRKRFRHEHQGQLVRLINGLIDAGIRHGDLHAGNICVYNEERLVAIDFGSATPSVDFSKGTSPDHEKGALLNSLLYAPGQGLVPTKLLRASQVTELDRQLNTWGFRSPNSKRASGARAAPTPVADTRKRKR